MISASLAPEVLNQRNAIPNGYTHTVLLDIVNIDTTVRRVEINYCSTDQWSGCMPDALGIAELLTAAISQIVQRDRYAVGYNTSIIRRSTGKAIPIFITPLVFKPEYLVNNPANANSKQTNYQTA